MNQNTRVPLPAGFTKAKSFEYGIDINLGTYDSPIWQAFRRITGFGVVPTPIPQDGATYDSLGNPEPEVTGWSYNGSFSVQGNRNVNTGLFLPEVEALLALQRPSATGDRAVGDFRWYHKPAEGKPNPLDAGRGAATIALARVATGNDGAIDGWAVTLTGVGAYEEIANPWTGWADETLPKVNGITPAGRGTGQLINISGAGFSGATDVKFGTTSATSLLVLSNGTIAATVPAGSAGPVAVTVVTPRGTSPAFSYTRAA